LSFNGNLQPSSDAGEDLTTKGDVHGYSTENTRVPVGVDGTVLTARSTDSYGIAWEAAGGGDTDPEKVVMAATSTIGDYDTPQDATSSSAEAGDPTYEFDFSSATGWTLGDHWTISGGAANISSDSTLDGDRSYYDLGSSLSSTFVIRFKINFSTLSRPNDSDYNLFMGVKSSSAKRGSTSDIDGLFAMINLRNSSGIQSEQLQASIADDDAYNSGDRASGGDGYYDMSTDTDYYLELIKESTGGGGAVGSFTFNIYSDAAYSIRINQATNTTSTKDPEDLQYVWFGITDYSGAGRSPLQWIGSISDLKIYDNTTTVENALGLIDGDTSTVWKSTNENNPNVYVDCTGTSTDTNLSQMALWANSDTTATEIKIQYSTNAGAAASWTDLRTIPVSDLTNGQYNYIRWNNQSGRFVRVYATDAGNTILAFNQIKVFEPSDSATASQHGHLGISATDTTLNLDGT
jgi:hypothetical protein